MLAQPEGLSFYPGSSSLILARTLFFTVKGHYYPSYKMIQFLFLRLCFAPFTMNIIMDSEVLDTQS